MTRKVFPWLLLALLGAPAGAVSAQPKNKPKFKEITDPAEAKLDPDFSVQGEYINEGTMVVTGAQVIALGDGQFEVVLYNGGLPAESWRRGDPLFRLQGKREGEVTRLEGGTVRDQAVSGELVGGKMTLTRADGRTERLRRIERKSVTLEAKPPAGAIVLFDGQSAEKFDHPEHLTPLKTLESGVTSKDQFGSCRLHLEFRLSWMPEARGQARSNSGVYIHDCYEIQVLDSFGLEGKDNECGGFYKLKEPDVNLCFPPLCWQSYDIDFTAPKYEGDKKVANARITVRHNNEVIHDDVELAHATPGRQPEGPAPRPLHLQGHGNHVQYRNIWLVEKK
jgi:hypothetical protein